MTMRLLSLVLILAFTSCERRTSPPAAPPDDRAALRTLQYKAGDEPWTKQGYTSNGRGEFTDSLYISYWAKGTDNLLVLERVHGHDFFHLTCQPLDSIHLSIPAGHEIAGVRRESDTDGEFDYPAEVSIDSGRVFRVWFVDTIRGVFVPSDTAGFVLNDGTDGCEGEDEE